MIEGTFSGVIIFPREYALPQLSVVPYSPLGGGLLAGVPRSPEDGRRAALSERFVSYAPQLEQYEALCRELGGTAGRCRVGLATAPSRGHRAHYWSEDHGAVDRLPARGRNSMGRGGDCEAGRNLARPRRSSPRGVRMVAAIRMSGSVSKQDTM